MEIRTVGVVGLGNMGLGMGATLVRKGFRVVGYDISDARRTAIDGAGVIFAPVLNDVLRTADALVFSLPLARDVEAVVTADGGLLARDCPTSAPVGQIEGLHERRMAGSS